MFRTFNISIAVGGVLLATLCLSGCRISSHKTNGKEDVSIDTPLGGFAVKTDPSEVLSRIGLPQYPGSVRMKNNGTDKDSADVNLSFGSFHLRVLAASFQTSDDRAVVEQFYRKALMQYSDVIVCHNGEPIGKPTRTGLGLNCEEDNHVHTGRHHSTQGSDLELRAGSPSRQHIVGLESRDSGTRFSLIALDLPHDSGADSKD